MAFAHQSYTDRAPSEDLDRGHETHSKCPCSADDAIHALEDAVDAIARDDIEGRFIAISAATEAVTALFLEMDTIKRGALAQGVGRIYEAILSRLMRVNLHNDPLIARETIAMLRPLRKDRAGIDTPAWRPTEVAGQRSNP